MFDFDPEITTANIINMKSDGGIDLDVVKEILKKAGNILNFNIKK